MFFVEELMFYVFLKNEICEIICEKNMPGISISFTNLSVHNLI